MDNISSIPPPSYSPPTSHSLTTIVAPIPPTIPRPIYWALQYEYHGLSFDLLPSKIQSFLSSHGLDNAAHYDPAAVTTIRLWLTDKFMDTVSGVCEAIAHANVRYNLLRTMYPVCNPSLRLLVHILRKDLLPLLEQHIAQHLALADALVWADVAAREGSPEALSIEEALHYRWLQTQPTLDLVSTRLVELYEWSAAMWMMGWRSDGSTTFLYIPPTPASPVDAGMEAAEDSAVPPRALTVLARPGTPGCTIAGTNVELPPVRPSTPPRSAQSPAPASSPQTPRSARRVAATPPSTPCRTCTPPGITQSAPRSLSQWSPPMAQSPTPAKYAAVSVGRALPQRAR